MILQQIMRVSFHPNLYDQIKNEKGIQVPQKEVQESIEILRYANTRSTILLSHQKHRLVSSCNFQRAN